MTQTVVGLYDDYRAAQDAVRELNVRGIRNDNISMIVSNPKEVFGDYTMGDEENSLVITSAAGGGLMGSLVGLIAGLGALAIPGVGPVIAGGPLIGALAGAGLGALAGGLVGNFVKLGMSEEEAVVYAEGVRRGSVLVAVDSEPDQVESVVSILNTYGAVDIDRRAEEWRASGWKGFDDSTPFSAEQFRQEREARRQVREARDGNVDPDGVHVRAYMRRPEPDPVTGRPARGEIVEEATVVEGGVAQTIAIHPSGIASDQGRMGATITTDAPAEPMGRRPDFDTFERQFHQHFESHYGSTAGHNYAQYRPAYEYGYHLAIHPRYAGHPWSGVEDDARRYWEESNPSTWDQIADAVRFAWHEVNGPR